MNNHSSYSAALTGCAFLYPEFLRVLPLLMAEDSVELIKEEVRNNHLLQVNSQKARQTFTTEFRRRFNAVPRGFWEGFGTMSPNGQKAALLYAVLKAYKLAFDFHFNITVRRWNSIEQTVGVADLMMELNEIAARDSFVDGWTDNTKRKCVSQYLTILRQAGMLQGSEGHLVPLRLNDADWAYLIRSAEEWFPEAALLYPYEVSQLKSRFL